MTRWPRSTPETRSRWFRGPTPLWQSQQQNEATTSPPAGGSCVADTPAEIFVSPCARNKGDSVALGLGSGWGQTGDLIGETVATVESAAVPGFTKAAVAGHSSVMRSVAIGDTGRRALVFGTRTHFYEGRGVRSVVHAVRTAAAAGCRTIVLTNGCGGRGPY